MVSIDIVDFSLAVKTIPRGALRSLRCESSQSILNERDHMMERALALVALCLLGRVWIRRRPKQPSSTERRCAPAWRQLAGGVSSPTRSASVYRDGFSQGGVRQQPRYARAQSICVGIYNDGGVPEKPRDACGVGDHNRPKSGSSFRGEVPKVLCDGGEDADVRGVNETVPSSCVDEPVDFDADP